MGYIGALPSLRENQISKNMENDMETGLRPYRIKV